MSDSSVLRPAVFLDRDGTICEEVGYLNHLSRLMIYPWAARRDSATERSGTAGDRGDESVGRLARDFSGVAGGGSTSAAGAGAWAGAGAAGRGVLLHAPPRRQLRLPQAAAGTAATRGGRAWASTWRARLWSATATWTWPWRTPPEGAACMVMSGYGRGEYEFHRHEWPQAARARCRQFAGRGRNDSEGALVKERL